MIFYGRSKKVGCIPNATTLRSFCLTGRSFFMCFVLRVPDFVGRQSVFIARKLPFRG